MSKFSFGPQKNQIISEGAKKNELWKRFGGYLLSESEKGKIPLIVVGAGASAKHVMVFTNYPLETELIEEGLPCLGPMISHLQRFVLEIDEDDAEVSELKKLFNCMTDTMENVDREWLSKVFAFFSKTANKKVKKCWNQFCDWFFFQSIEANGKMYGALNTSASSTAKIVAELYDSVGAICLSANFDNYVAYALASKGLGLPIFDSGLAEKYFKRSRRGEKEFEAPPYNRCVLHANGDVFWVCCNGEKGEGYCPETGKHKPVFDVQNRSFSDSGELTCKFCGSPLEATMTMPGTYEKDYNTRAIIGTIWTYLASKISAIVTVGLSCNWDDVLLLFLLQLVKEREIPLLDINNFSDKSRGGSTAITEKIVKGSYLEACSVNLDAEEGVRLLNQGIGEAAGEREERKTNTDYLDISTVQTDLKENLEKHRIIRRLSKVSQLGLKSYWMESGDRNQRWKHSKEVADIAVRMYLRLHTNSKKRNSNFEIMLLYTAGLLHDCGHLPFSHLLEDVFEELSWRLQGEHTPFKHGHYTRWLIHRLCCDKNCILKQTLDQYHISESEVVKLIDGEYGVAYMDTLINSAIDADKIAYIFTDAENTQKNLMLKQADFLSHLLKKAYITQEGLVALDDESAWYAMRLLDERKRMYEELYYSSRIRFLEAATKYIVATYFVQKYNHDSIYSENGIGGEERAIEDMGHLHIMEAVEDLFSMLDDKDQYQAVNLTESLGENIKHSVRRCMKLVLNAQKTEGHRVLEIDILQKICLQLLGEEVTPDSDADEPVSIYTPYHDPQLDELVSRLRYEELNAVRKKIILNYPGTILIDIYVTTRYFSTPDARKSRKRMDGTECPQEMILVPETPKEQWMNQKCPANTGLSEYAKNYHLEGDRKTVFHVFKIDPDSTACDHAINMLKKELESAGR